MCCLLALWLSPLHAAVEISELNIHAGGLSGQLQDLRGEEGELSEGVRVVEEDVRERRRERERECRSRVADTQAEAIRLRRELEVCSCNNTIGQYVSSLF